MKKSSTPPAERVRQVVLAIELELDELACRMLEERHNIDRPVNVTATEALDEMPAAVQLGFRRCAWIAMEYFEEQIKAGHPVS